MFSVFSIVLVCFRCFLSYWGFVGIFGVFCRVGVFCVVWVCFVSFGCVLWFGCVLCRLGCILVPIEVETTHASILVYIHTHISNDFGARQPHRRVSTAGLHGKFSSGVLSRQACTASFLA